MKCVGPIDESLLTNVEFRNLLVLSSSTLVPNLAAGDRAGRLEPYLDGVFEFSLL